MRTRIAPMHVTSGLPATDGSDDTWDVRALIGSRPWPLEIRVAPVTRWTVQHGVMKGTRSGVCGRARDEHSEVLLLEGVVVSDEGFASGLRGPWRMGRECPPIAVVVLWDEADRCARLAFGDPNDSSRILAMAVLNATRCIPLPLGDVQITHISYEAQQVRCTLAHRGYAFDAVLTAGGAGWIFEVRMSGRDVPGSPRPSRSWQSSEPSIGTAVAELTAGAYRLSMDLAGL